MPHVALKKRKDKDPNTKHYGEPGRDINYPVPMPKERMPYRVTTDLTPAKVPLLALLKKKKER